MQVSNPSTRDRQIPDPQTPDRKSADEKRPDGHRPKDQRAQRHCSESRGPCNLGANRPSPRRRSGCGGGARRATRWVDCGGGGGGGECFRHGHLLSAPLTSVTAQRPTKCRLPLRPRGERWPPARCSWLADLHIATGGRFRPLRRPEREDQQRRPLAGRQDPKCRSGQLLRVKGDLLLLQGASEAAAAAEIFGRRSTRHVGKARAPGNCARPRAKRGGSAIRAVSPMRCPCSSWSRTGSPRGSTPPTLRRHRRSCTISARPVSPETH